MVLWDKCKSCWSPDPGDWEAVTKTGAPEVCISPFLWHASDLEQGRGREWDGKHWPAFPEEHTPRGPQVRAKPEGCLSGHSSRTNKPLPQKDGGCFSLSAVLVSLPWSVSLIVTGLGDPGTSATLATRAWWSRGFPGQWLQKSRYQVCVKAPSGRYWHFGSQQKERVNSTHAEVLEKITVGP